jgi:hypothetical protein
MLWEVAYADGVLDARRGRAHPPPCHADLRRRPGADAGAPAGACADGGEGAVVNCAAAARVGPLPEKSSRVSCDPNVRRSTTREDFSTLPRGEGDSSRMTANWRCCRHRVRRTISARCRRRLSRNDRATSCSRAPEKNSATPYLIAKRRVIAKVSQAKWIG